MRLKPGQGTYKFPPCGKVNEAVVQGNQKHNQMASYILYPLSVEDYLRRDQTKVGFPTSYVVIGSEIKFWPIPDHAYLVRVCYTPPMKVW